MAAPASASASAIESGHQIGPYTLTREIGKGSFAVVFQGKVRPAPVSQAGEEARALSAASVSTVTRVAIKIVTRKKLTPKLLENLEGEISILRTVRHVNIVELLDCLKTDSHIYLIMQFCRMGDLSNFIRSRRSSESDKKQSERRRDPFEEEMDRQYPSPHDGGLHSDMTRSFLAQLASALQFMRGKNIVHRDIKPQNLLLQEPEPEMIATGHPAFIPQLKVADFGFARHLEAASLAETLCGSPLYMAPEILRYEKYDAKADLWSVGAVLFEMCVGKPPFRAPNHVELLRRIERGEDKIKFPDERSDESLRREQARKNEDGRDVGQLVRPHVVDEDIKRLIRGLLRRRPIERMSFDEFFMCEVLSDLKEKLAPRNTAVGQDASQLLSPSNSTTPFATRVAPAIPSNAPSKQINSSTTKTEAPVADPVNAFARGKPNADNTDNGLPPASPTPLIPARQYFTPKYVVGGHKESATSKPAVEQLKTSPGTPNLRSATVDTNEGEASSLEDNVLETPGSSVTHLPSTSTGSKGSTASTAMPGSVKDQRKQPVYDDDRGYVMVDKRNVDVNALADEFANKGKIKSGGWSPLGVVRRPSQLGRLASLGAISPLSVLGAYSQPANTPAPQVASTSRAPAVLGSPTSTAIPVQPLQRGQAVSTATMHQPSLSSSPAHVRLGSTPPNAPFALPPGARKPSFSRRTSNMSEGSRLAPQSPRPGLSPLVPSSAPLDAGTSSPTKSSNAAPITSSALGRAISMASIRLFGVPTGMSMRGAGVRRSLRMGLGTGTLLSSSPSQAFDPTNYTGLTTHDVAEQNLLSLLHEYGQKSFVLSEFADARLSTYFPEGPHQNNHMDRRRRASSSSLSSMTGGSIIRQTNTATSTTTAGSATGQSTTLISSEVAASEAYVLYARSLSFLQRALDAARAYVEARSGSASRYAVPLQPSQEVSEAIQWLRTAFNDGFERANFARSKSSEEMPESAQYIDKMIFEQALEIARGAAVDELENNRVDDQSWNAERCLLAYETACTMLQGLLDPGDANNDLSASAMGTIEKFVRSISKRMASIQRKFEHTTAVAV